MSEDLRFPVLGRPLAARAPAPRLREYLESHWRFPEHAPPAHAHFIDVESLARAPHDLRAGMRLTASLPGVRLDGHTLADGWTLGAERGGARLRAIEGGTRIETWGVERGVPEALAALHVALCEALRASGLQALHAAAAAREGEVTLFVASSGTGKSSTLVAAARAGWVPLAEDFVWVEPASLACWGWDRGVHLWPQGHARIETGERDATWTPVAGGKLFLPFAALVPPTVAQAQSGRPLARIALLVRDLGRASAWEPAAPREAVRALWESSGVPLDADARDRTSAWIPALLERVPVETLVLGSTPLPL